MASRKIKKEQPVEVNSTPKSIYGWGGIDEVAAEIKNSLHDQLLAGQFICAARGDWELQRMVVTRRLDYPDYFMLGIICKGWTMFNPGLPKTAILDFIQNDAKDKKVPQGILKDFEEILNNIN